MPQGLGMRNVAFLLFKITELLQKFLLIYSFHRVKINLALGLRADGYMSTLHGYYSWFLAFVNYLPHL